MSRVSTAHRYGFWPSRWSAGNAAAASRDFAELRAGHGGVLWIEFDPADARSTLWFQRAGERRCLSPAGVSLRSRVYEYGGGAFCVTRDGVAFVGEADQQVYRQALDGDPHALTDCAARRYGDLQHGAFGDAIFAVEEEHGDAGVRHRIVSLSLGDGAREVVIEGADFYAANGTARNNPGPPPGCASPSATRTGAGAARVAWPVRRVARRCSSRASPRMAACIA